MRRSVLLGRHWNALRRGAIRLLHWRLAQRIFWVATLTFAVVAVGIAGLWWRLTSGPIELDVATPWLKAAIEKNFGGKQTVSVGGTQIERDENGRTSLRLRDIVVRDADGTVVATAPKAEVGISGTGLLTGNVRASSLNLVGAELSVRIETDGRVTVFAGANKRPIATASSTLPAAQSNQPADSLPQAPLRGGAQDIAGILSWIDGLGATGLDGHDLRELGLKNGNLIVDDLRNGKRWTFSRINVSLTRPHQGGVIFRLASDDPDRPWVLTAAVRPLGDGVRAVGIEARHVSSKDILLAMRLNEGDFDVDLPLSGSVRAEISSDGTLQQLQGQVIVDQGTVIDRVGENANVKIDRADIRFNWDGRARSLIIPFQIQAGGDQFTLRAAFEAPPDQDGVWLFNIVRGDPVIDPVILVSAGKPEEGFALNRVVVRARIDTVRRRIDLEQGDFSRIDTRPSHNIAVAVTGSLDYSGAEPHLAFGVAGTRMPMDVMMRIWPVFTAVQVREWVVEHISGGTVERVVVAGNAPLKSFKADGPPMLDEGLSVEIETSGTTLRPLATLPAIRDADLTAHITGGFANLSVGRGTVEVTPGRKLNIANGVFEIPNTHLKPQPARVNFRIDGSMPAVAALLASEGLRDNVEIVLDPAASRGSVAAQVTVNLLVGRDVPKNSATYIVTANLTNFAADKMLMGQRVEASALRVSASSDGYQITGDVKINGTPATIDLSKRKGAADAELRMQAMIDETARRRLGINLGGTVTGTIPVKVVTRTSNDNNDPPMTVDADLTPVKIDDLLPGWVKPAGKPAHATYTLVKTAQSLRFDDLTISGSGANVKGSVELDAASDIVSANFPVFSLADGDKVSLKADRGSDGVLRVTMRGDVFDGTHFVKASVAGAAPDKAGQQQTDLDLDIKLGIVVGHNGETLRGLDIKLCAQGRPYSQFHDERQDRPRHAAQRRPACAQPRQSPGRLFRNRRRRRVVPVHRHVSAHVRRANVGGNGSAVTGTDAASRHPLYPQFRRARRTWARSRGFRRARPGQQRRAIQRGALRIHEGARAHGGERRRRAWTCGGCDRRRPDRLRQGRHAPARNIRAILRSQQHVRADSDRRAVPGRRQQRGPARHHLRGGRPAGRAAHLGQSGDGDRARAAAQIHPVARQYGSQFHSAVALNRASNATRSALYSSPSREGLIAPSGVAAFGGSAAFVSSLNLLVDPEYRSGFDLAARFDRWRRRERNFREWP